MGSFLGSGGSFLMEGLLVTISSSGSHFSLWHLPCRFCADLFIQFPLLLSWKFLVELAWYFIVLALSVRLFQRQPLPLVYRIIDLALSLHDGGHLLAFALTLHAPHSWWASPVTRFHMQEQKKEWISNKYIFCSSYMWPSRTVNVEALYNNKCTEGSIVL